MLKKNEPDWIEHDRSSTCPVPDGHDVEVRWRPRDLGPTDSRNDKPSVWDWRYIVAYRDWTAFEQQQASAGKSVPYWAWKRAVELTGPNPSSSQVLLDFARYIAANEPKGEVPKLLTEADVVRMAPMNTNQRAAFLRERGLIAPEPEPDALRDLAEELAAVKAREAKLRACLGFFASVIKSGEPWTATCEQRYRAALSEQQP